MGMKSESLCLSPRCPRTTRTQLADLYRTRAEYNFKRLERIENGPRRAPALTTVRHLAEPLCACQLHGAWGGLR